MELLERVFGPKTYEAVAHQELEESRRNLIECERMRDYYDNMVNFHRTRIARLDVGRLDVHP